jgi:restriction system protein
MLDNKSYYRIMLGRKSKFAQDCLDGKFIGCDFDFDKDLKNSLCDNWKEFNREHIPIFLQRSPESSKIAAGLACGATHTICKGIKAGDIVLCPNGQGDYLIGEVSSDYYYEAGDILPHRRKVNWYPNNIHRSNMSQPLKNSTGSIGTVSNITKYSDEIKELIKGNEPDVLMATDQTVEDVTVFALEKHLEEFLVKNWGKTELGKNFDIYEVDGEIVGQQFQTDTGNLDILAISKDKKELLVVELKKGRASDAVIGQIQRYMGYIADELCEENQVVKGVIIALDDDLRIQRALSVTQNIEFYRYSVSFKLYKN